MKLNRYPVLAGTRAEYTASLSIFETDQVTPRHELPVGSAQSTPRGGTCDFTVIDQANGNASD